MLPLLLLLLTAQVPAVPGETTLVSSCKQGGLSACEALKQVNPTRAAEVMRGLEVLKAAEEAVEQPVADVDQEVIAWLTKYPKATPEQFLKFLREIYSRPKMVERFPNGF